MTCEIDNGEIVVRIQIENLPTIWDLCPLRIDETGEERINRNPVTNADAFAEEVRNALVSEDEDGSTLLTDAVDRAMYNAFENGAEGICYPEIGDACKPSVLSGP